MPRGKPKSIIPTEKLIVFIRAPLIARLQLHLWSEAEGKIPYGGYQKFFEERIQDFFDSEVLDLGTIAAGSAHIPTDTFYVRGAPQALEILKGITKC